MRRRPDGVVVGQAIALAALAWPGRPSWRLPGPVRSLGRATTAAGVVLAVLAGRAHGRRLTPSVEPPEGVELLRTGTYAMSRNPIYLGLLVGGAGWAVLRRRPEPLLAWAALLVVLNVKVRAEERRLRARFGAEYARYLARTPRFVGRPRCDAHHNTVHRTLSPRTVLHSS